jgi:hypothetical protein
LSRNLGASTYWNPEGLSRPVMGLIYLIRREENISVSTLALLDEVTGARKFDFNKTGEIYWVAK